MILVPPSSRFRNRRQAGDVLAELPVALRSRQDLSMLGAPCGVPVAIRVARASGALLDVPMAPVSTYAESASLTDRPIRLEGFFTIGEWYEDSAPTGDEEARQPSDEDETARADEAR